VSVQHIFFETDSKKIHKNIKGVIHDRTSVLDCVDCEACKRTAACKACADRPRKCKACDGDGEITCDHCGHESDCDDCGGSGECPDCNGTALCWACCEARIPNGDTLASIMRQRR